MENKELTEENQRLRMELEKMKDSREKILEELLQVNKAKRLIEQTNFTPTAWATPIHYGEINRMQIEERDRNVKGEIVKGTPEYFIRLKPERPLYSNAYGRQWDNIAHWWHLKLDRKETNPLVHLPSIEEATKPDRKEENPEVSLNYKSMKLKKREEMEPDDERSPKEWTKEGDDGSPSHPFQKSEEEEKEILSANSNSNVFKILAPPDKTWKTPKHVYKKYLFGAEMSIMFVI